MIQRILGSLLPIILVALTGFLLARRKRISSDTRRGLNYLAYWIGLPSLLFIRSFEADLARTESLPMMTVLLIGMAATVVSGAVVCRWRRYSPSTRAVVLQASFRGNLVFIGLPVLFYAMEGLGATRRDQMVSDILLAAAPVILVYNVVAVLILSLNGPRHGKGVGSAMWRTLFTNPLILSVLAGLLFNLVGVRLPAPVMRTLRVLENMALPLALLGIGAQLAEVHVHAFREAVWASALLKLVLSPLAGGLAAWGMGMPPDTIRALLIFLATPTAVSSYVLADQMGADRDLAAGCVMASTLFSVVSFSVVLMM